MKKLFMFTIALISVFAFTAVAGQDANAFDEIWTELSSWAVNAPGKILALLTFGAAIFMGVVKQNWMAATGAFIGAMLIAQAETVITFFLDGTLPPVM